MSDNGQDILGNDLDAVEQEALAIHRRMEAMLGRDDLSPCVEANLRHALAATWQVLIDLGIEYRPEALGEPR